MTNKLEQLELVQVEYKDSSAILMFVDEESGYLRKVKFNKQSFDPQKNKFVDDPEKAEKVEGWCEEYFDTSFDNLESAIGVRKDIYVYDGFCSLFEVQQVNKFPEEMVGDIFNTEILEIGDSGEKIYVKYEYDGLLYESKFSYATYVQRTKQWLVDPEDKKKALEKFYKKFNVEYDEKDSLIGKSIMVEVKKIGKHTYGEIKPLKKKQ